MLIVLYLYGNLIFIMIFSLSFNYSKNLLFLLLFLLLTNTVLDLKYLKFSGVLFDFEDFVH